MPKGIPLAGDRAAWDADGYPERHANDIDAADGIHHTIGTDEGQVAPGVHTHVEAEITDLDHTDANAIHDDVPGEIAAIDEKTTPDDADVTIIEDSGASYAKKRLSWANIKAALKTYFDTIYAALSHTHTETDITDLDHDAAKINGIEVDLTGIADGDALVYDGVAEKIIPGEGGGGGASAFTDLTDVPASYTGQAGKFPKVKATEDGLEFASVAGGGLVRETIFTFAGDLEVGSNPFKIYNKFGSSQTISQVFLSIATAPAGANVVVDIHKNGTTIFTNQSNRPAITDGNTEGYTTTIDVSTWADGEYLTAHIDQIGSNTPGANLVVHVIHS